MTITPAEGAPVVAAIEPMVKAPSASQDRAEGGTHPAPVKSVDHSREASAAPAADALGQEDEPLAPAPEFPFRELSMRLDPEINRLVVQVIDSKSGTVLRQLPPEEVVKVLKELSQKRGVLVDREG